MRLAFRSTASHHAWWYSIQRFEWIGSTTLRKSSVAQLACASSGVNENDVVGEITLTSNRRRLAYESDLRNAYPPQPVPSTTRRCLRALASACALCVCVPYRRTCIHRERVIVHMSYARSCQRAIVVSVQANAIRYANRDP